MLKPTPTSRFRPPDHAEDGRRGHGADHRPTDGEVHLLPVAGLAAADTPRLSGEDAEHTLTLADAEAELPPILVHRATMRVIDGMHRLRAAQLIGRRLIKAVFYEGSEDDAFVQAVKANITHGLPLSAADRRAAAVRIMTSHLHWSDRAIAHVTGLAPATVSTLRREIADEHTAPQSRIGRDGRVRPLDAQHGRRIAAELIGLNPDASLRQIAKAAGISPTTALDVRNQLQSAKAGAAEPRMHSEAEAERSDQPAARDTDKRRIISRLSKDPSLRLKQSGRVLLQWLVQHSRGLESWPDLVGSIPPHCLYALANLAQACASDWQAFADELKKRARASGETTMG